MASTKDDIKAARDRLTEALDLMDDSGWYQYPDLAPEEPRGEDHPDNMPRLEDYPDDDLGKESFLDDRCVWIQDHLKPYLAWVHGAEMPIILFWGGSDLQDDAWMDAEGNTYRVDAWHDLPERPLFLDEVA